MDMFYVAVCKLLICIKYKEYNNMFELNVDLYNKSYIIPGIASCIEMKSMISEDVLMWYMHVYIILQ